MWDGDFTHSSFTFLYLGTTQAIIPILKKLGIAALSIGVNGATNPAAVPPVFLWKNGNDSIITLYHPGIMLDFYLA